MANLTVSPAGPALTSDPWQRSGRRLTFPPLVPVQNVHPALQAVPEAAPAQEAPLRQQPAHRGRPPADGEEVAHRQVGGGERLCVSSADSHHLSGRCRKMPEKLRSRCGFFGDHGFDNKITSMRVRDWSVTGVGGWGGGIDSNRRTLMGSHDRSASHF